MKVNKIFSLDKILILFFIFLGFIVIFLIENKSNKIAEIKNAKLAAVNQSNNNKGERYLNEADKYQKLTSKLNLPTRNININIYDEKFDPSIIKIKKGERVLFKINVKEGYHNLIIDKYSIYSRNIPTNENDQLFFLATKSGTLNFYSNTGLYKIEPGGEIIINE